MKQVLQNLRSGATEVAETPIPTPREGMLLVRTAASLVSAGTERMVVEFAGKSLLGKARSRPDLARQVLDKARREGLLTTLEAAFNRLDQPMPLGYSSAGVIAALGPGVGDLRARQRVACAGGGYAVHAEYAVVPRNLVAPLPDEVDFASAAFTTLGAIALHGFRLAEAQLGERVAVIGLGLLGLLAGQIARAAGCAVLGVDVDEQRVALAEALGIQAAGRAQAEEAGRAFSRGRGCDAILICADTPSSDPVELAGALARDRARVVAVGAVGLQIPRKIYYEKELSFVNSRSYGPGRYDAAYEEGGKDYPPGYVRWTEGRNLEAFVDLLASGRVQCAPLITHRFPIEAAPQAYALITGETKEPFLGVLLTYPEQGLGGGEWGEGRGEQENGIGDREKGIREGGSGTGDQVRGAGDGVRLGVLGAGNFASAVLLPAVKKAGGVELVAVASASGASARHAAQRFGFQRAASGEESVLRDPQVNTVAILTRHHLHAAQAVQALNAGKHVFCEKPLALSLEESEQVRAALQEAGERAPQSPPLFMVGFNRRFAPLVVGLQRFIAARKEPLYAHYRVNAGYLPASHWTQNLALGGGRILGEGCHFIDFLVFLTGQLPVSVTARALPDGGVYHEDNALLTFDFPDGSLGAVTYLANGDKSFTKERVEVFAGGRVGVLDDFRSLELVHGGKRQAQRSRLRLDKGHLGEWQAFAAAIARGGPPPIPYEQLFGVQRAALAAGQALRSGERVLIAS
ncbi:MAG: bi-domain-containing oxidoreductase [Chloroflexi bacterium]|nr:bi-domain-containing oxidoreductase [Chloroflexota bacterium]